ncbi:hypothetical protein [Luteolibacter sp. LG18]|uniref:alpha/beta hydrolase family protein n=1 Tax=Luteolibacter sp. LG18 TaxID=2819286 RepID=UPI002B2FCC04|nr:hypothetical protein llg_25330 [Luteolibacter sp. LG18]
MRFPVRQLLGCLFPLVAGVSAAQSLSITPAAGGYQLTYPSTSARPWRVSASANLGDWLYEPTVTVGNGQLQTASVAASGAKRFWRVTQFPVDAAYKATAGPFSVAPYQDETWTDPARNYPMPVRIYAPATGQAGVPYATVVLSHGIYGSIGAFDWLSTYLASHGYIAVMIQHDDSRNFSREERPADVSFALDRLLGSPTNPLLAGRVDATRLAHGGHSFGAFTCLAVMGSTYQRAGANSQVVTHPDARLRCGFAMSPQGEGVVGLSADSWNAITRPVMTMQGTDDTDPWVTDPATRREPYAKMPAGNKAHLTLQGATHGSFTDNGIAVDGAIYTQWYFPAIVAFLDANLNGNATARGWLDALTVSRLSANAAVLETK